MFLFKARGYLEELAKFHPDTYEACRSAASALEKDIDFLRIKKRLEACPSESADCAVIAKD